MSYDIYMDEMLDEMLTAVVATEDLFAGLSDDQIIAAVRFGLPAELRNSRSSVSGAPLQMRRTFVKLETEVIEIWILREDFSWSHERRADRALVTDGQNVFEIDAWAIVPGTL